ncbi:MAG TPA: ABC transporter permease subunit [Planctomycetota bacterium]|nr:ABC transporter permease subunit [Planctomycetota bacterium]
MRRALAVARRELGGYFATPIATIFIVVFLLLSAFFTFNMGGLYERGQADLRPFFQFHPWLYLFLVPAVSMRLWAEERRSGTIELLTTLPLTLGEAVLGKFLAAWAFVGLALALTFPTWLSVAYLGEPDHGTIAAGYLASWLMAGAFLAVGSLLSALTKNQVVAFVLTVSACLVLTLAGEPEVLRFLAGPAPQLVVDAVAFVGFRTHFDALARGVVEATGVVYFASASALFLYLNVLVLRSHEAA